MTIEQKKEIKEELFKDMLKNHKIYEIADILTKSIKYPDIETDKENYDQLLSWYHELDNFVEYLFSKYLAKDCGYDCNSPQWKVVYSKAYEDGHSEGYESIFSKAKNICAFISKYEDAKN